MGSVGSADPAVGIREGRVAGVANMDTHRFDTLYPRPHELHHRGASDPFRNRARHRGFGRGQGMKRAATVITLDDGKRFSRWTVPVDRGRVASGSSLGPMGQGPGALE